MTPTAHERARRHRRPTGGTLPLARTQNTPHELHALWQTGEWNEIVRGAVMMFEDTHDLDVDGFVGPKVWGALLADTLAGRKRTDGYSYVYVHRNVPQSLTLWHDGQDDPPLAGQHRRARRADPARHLPGLRAHPDRDDERHEPRRLPLQRSRHPLDQLLQPRRRDPRLQRARASARRRASAASSSRSRRRRRCGRTRRSARSSRSRTESTEGGDSRMRRCGSGLPRFSVPSTPTRPQTRLHRWREISATS